MVTYIPFSQEKIKEIAKKVNFFSPHNHTEISNFRLRDCIIKIPDLINRGLELNYLGICCTDHEALTAHVKFIKRYKELKELKIKYDQLIKEGKIEEAKKDKDIKKNLKYIENFSENFKIGLGNEIYLIDSLEDVKSYYHFILIAKNKKGYQQIKQISSESAWKNWKKERLNERVPTLKKELEEIIGEEKGNIIASSSCLGGELDKLILEYLETENILIKKEINNFIRWCIKVFGKENFYLEIQPCILKKDENGEYIPHKQALVNQFMFELSNAYGLKVCCSTDSHYLLKEDRLIHEAYLKADDEDKIRSRETGEFYETTYMFSVEELIENFSYHLTEEQIIKAFKGTEEMWKDIEIFDLYHPTIVPTDKKIPDFKISHKFSKWYDKYEYIKKFAESDNLQDRYLLYLIEEGMDNLKQWGDSKFVFHSYDYNGNIISSSEKKVTQEEKIARINEELSSFWQISERLNQKLSSYYVLVRGLVQEVMWKISYVGVGRGSVGGCYIAYLIEIIQLNPLKYDLPFWRHSSPLRPELPDLKF